MRVLSTALPEVLILETPKVEDIRGFFMEIFHADKFRARALPYYFAQDNYSHSKRHVLRGLHYQVEEPQGKLIRVVSGTIFDVAVDLRRSSPNFGRWFGETLNADEMRQMWIPPGFGHGFLVLSEFADVSYKCTTVYRATGDRNIRWDDPMIGVKWPLPAGAIPLLSERDQDAPYLQTEACFP